jgi:glycosyltransferase involved in cell wall biosynthesis
VPYFNKARHFPQLLKSLEYQTCTNFRVIAVDDGSADPESIEVFDAMADEYRQRGWIFFRQDNQFVDSARNRAAERATAEYLLFIDADDVLAANAIECLLNAALQTGDDCLTPGVAIFR